MDKFQEKRSKNGKKIVKKSWCDWYFWLINYISKPIKITKKRLNKFLNQKKIIKQSKKKQLKIVRPFYEHQEEKYYEPVNNIFGIAIIQNMRVMVIEIKTYQSKNILIKLNHI